jgi:hypothetical protein
MDILGDSRLPVWAPAGFVSLFFVLFLFGVEPPQLIISLNRKL